MTVCDFISDRFIFKYILLSSRDNVLYLPKYYRIGVRVSLVSVFFFAAYFMFLLIFLPCLWYLTDHI